MRIAIRIMLVVSAVVFIAVVVGVFAFAYGQSVGNVGKVGQLMSPTPATGGGPSPPDPFGIITEADQPLTTEADSPLVTEAAP